YILAYTNDQHFPGEGILMRLVCFIVII
ncbi:MAG: hypothetical protein JWQ78_568, partial [Sediminibacterium sp.]|nr:hypothetical protein [Sediminibacterium sp.]